jgi:hypothetical protein
MYPHLIENGAEAFTWKKFDTEGVGLRNLSYIQNALIVGGTSRVRGPGESGAVFGPKTDFWMAGPLTVVNYGTAGALRVCFECNDETELRQGGYTFRFQGLTWVNTTRKFLWTAPFKEIISDLDGTITGFAGGWVAPYYPWSVSACACMFMFVSMCVCVSLSLRVPLCVSLSPSPSQHVLLLAVYLLRCRRVGSHSCVVSMSRAGMTSRRRAVAAASSSTTAPCVTTR